MNVRQMHAHNRSAWNEAAEHYAEISEKSIALLRSGMTNFCESERPYLADLNSWCGRAIHLQCAGGLDTLSLWKLGVAEVVGVDMSENMIALARAKSQALNAPAHWFCCDVLETPHELDATADLVYTGRGAINWLHDMNGWAAVVSRLLKPGGRFYLFEGHPLTWIWDQAATELKLDAQCGNYFDNEPLEEQGWGPTYVGDLANPKEALSHKYESQKTFGQILNPLLQHGLRLEKIEEHSEAYWNQFPHLPPETVAKLPNTFSLLMQKD
jgi:SAM-dependent methyltransferase